MPEFSIPHARARARPGARPRARKTCSIPHARARARACAARRAAGGSALLPKALLAPILGLVLRPLSRSARAPGSRTHAAPCHPRTGGVGSCVIAAAHTIDAADRIDTAQPPMACRPSTHGVGAAHGTVAVRRNAADHGHDIGAAHGIGVASGQRPAPQAAAHEGETRPGRDPAPLDPTQLSLRESVGVGHGGSSRTRCVVRAGAESFFRLKPCCSGGARSNAKVP